MFEISETLDSKARSLGGFETEDIATLFEARVREAPRAVAVLDESKSLSYGELNAKANAFARILEADGIGPGLTVGVAFERVIELPIALLAILKLGAVYVPLDVKSPDERLAFTIGDAALSAVVTCGPLSASSPCSGVATVDVLACDEAVELNPTRPPANSCLSNEPAYIMYTSGSTGRPKGVAISHRNVARLVRGADYCEMAPGQIFLHFAPLAFDASTFEIWAPLLNGATLAIAKPGLHTIAEIGATIKRFGVTTMWFTTAIFNRVVDSRLPDFAGLHHVLTGGDAASVRHVREFLAQYPSCRLTNGYGPTENTTFSLCCDLSALGPISDDVPIGSAIAHSTAYVLDERLQPVPTGVIGELCVGGDGVGLGYIGLPELTAERFVPDPFSAKPGARMYRTGDRAQFRTDGLVSFLGREDDQVKIRGYRIELGEIESALLLCVEVSDAAVIVIDDEAGNKILMAFVVMTAVSQLTSIDLRTWLSAKLPAFMIPHRIEITDRLPEHASGKLDRVALKAYAKGFIAPTATVRAVAPFVRGRAIGGKVEVVRVVRACWREALGEEPLEDANFFDAGGDSLRLLTLHDNLKSAFGVQFAAIALFEHSTIAAQAAFLLRLLSRETRPFRGERA